LTPSIRTDRLAALVVWAWHTHTASSRPTVDEFGWRAAPTKAPPSTWSFHWHSRAAN